MRPTEAGELSQGAYNESVKVLRRGYPPRWRVDIKRSSLKKVINSWREYVWQDRSAHSWSIPGLSPMCITEREVAPMLQCSLVFCRSCYDYKFQMEEKEVFLCTMASSHRCESRFRMHACEERKRLSWLNAATCGCERARRSTVHVLQRLERL